jgi:hypothetical protein
MVGASPIVAQRGDGPGVKSRTDGAAALPYDVTSHLTQENPMGILSNIFHKIFPSNHPASEASAQQVSTPGSQQSASPQAATQPARSASAAPPSAPMQEVDVEAILTNMAAAKGQSLDWRTSIVDLLKLLNLDSSLASRTALAHELDYKGDTGDTAAMNQWLHRQVMTRLAANGGKVPDDLKN